MARLYVGLRIKTGPEQAHMKKLLFTVSLLVSVLLPALAGSISKSQISSFISDCSRYEGVEVVRLGRLATSALKATIRIAEIDDPEAREALQIFSGIKRVAILDYEDCDPAVREKIARKLDRMLSGGDLLMEAKDDNDRLQIYGVVDDRNGTVRDFVMHAPNSYSLICVFGSISMKKLAKLIEDND